MAQKTPPSRLETAEIDTELQSIVAEAWQRSDQPQTRFAQLLRNEAKVVGVFHDPAACTHDLEFREALESCYEESELSQKEFSRQLRTLAQGYENAPEQEIAAVEQGS